MKDSTVYNLVPCRNGDLHLSFYVHLLSVSVANRRIKLVDNTHRFCGERSDRYFKPAFVDALERYLVISREKDEEMLRAFTTTKYNAIVMSIIVSLALSSRY